MCFVEINIIYSQNEVAKRVQYNIDQLNFAGIEESRQDPQLKTFSNFS